MYKYVKSSLGDCIVYNGNLFWYKRGKAPQPWPTETFGNIGPADPMRLYFYDPTYAIQSPSRHRGYFSNEVRYNCWLWSHGWYADSGGYGVAELQFTVPSTHYCYGDAINYMKGRQPRFAWLYNRLAAEIGGYPSPSALEELHEKIQRGEAEPQRYLVDVFIYPNGDIERIVRT